MRLGARKHRCCGLPASISSDRKRSMDRPAVRVTFTIRGDMPYPANPSQPEFTAHPKSDATKDLSLLVTTVVEEGKDPWLALNEAPAFVFSDEYIIA